MSALFSRLLLAAILAAPLSGGVIYEFETKNHGGAGLQAESNRVAIEGDRMRLDIYETAGQPPSNSMVYLGGSRKMISIDHKKKRYFEIDKEMIEGVMGQMSQAMKQLEQQLQNLPPEQRARMEKMFKQRMGGAIETPEYAVSPLGGSQTVNGYSCKLYQVTEDGSKVREVCATAWGEVPGSQEAAAVMKDMANFAQDLVSAAQKAVPMGMAGAGNPVAHLDQIDGFPVATREFNNGQLAAESTLKSASIETVAASEFQPPAGYKRQDTGLKR